MTLKTNSCQIKSLVSKLDCVHFSLVWTWSLLVISKCYPATIVVRVSAENVEFNYSTPVVTLLLLLSLL